MGRSIAGVNDLVDAARRIAEETRFSGVIRLDAADGLRSVEAFGLAHRGLHVPNTDGMQFAVASGGKGFTALAVVRLIVDGAFSLETPVRSLLGRDLPLVADEVTVGHLLSHRSGMGDYLDEEEVDSRDYVLKRPVHELVTTEAFLEEVDGYPTKFRAGERFSYCNGGYIVLALIAERVGGLGYHELVEETVLIPAELTETAFLRSDEPSGSMALGYLDDEGLRTNVLHLPVRGNGDGGIYTTVADMRRFWNAFFDGRIVPEEWVAEMTRPHSEVPEESARYGLGFWLAEAGPIVKLVGLDAGVSFYSGHDPTTRSTWTVISNTSDGVWPIARLLRSAFEAPHA